MSLLGRSRPFDRLDRFRGPRLPYQALTRLCLFEASWTTSCAQRTGRSCVLHGAPVPTLASYLLHFFLGDRVASCSSSVQPASDHSGRARCIITFLSPSPGRAPAPPHHHVECCRYPQGACRHPVLCPASPWLWQCFFSLFERRSEDTVCPAPRSRPLHSDPTCRISPRRSQYCRLRTAHVAAPCAKNFLSSRYIPPLLCGAAVCR